MSYRAKQASSNTASKFIEFALVPLLKELEEPKNAIHINLLAMQPLSKRSFSSVPKTDSFNTTDINKEDHDNESAAHNNRQDNLSTNIEGNSSFDPVREESVVRSSLKQLDRKKKGGPRSQKSTVKKDGATLKRYRMRALLSLIDSNPSLYFSQSSNRLLLGSNSFQSGDQVDITNSVNLIEFLKNLQIHNKKLNGMERQIVETLLMVPITKDKVDHLKSLLLNRSAMQVIDDKVSSSKLSLE